MVECNFDFLKSYYNFENSFENNQNVCEFLFFILPQAF